MKTILCAMLLLSVASVARHATAQVIYGETWQDTITRRQLEDKLDDLRREQATDSLQRHMEHEEQKGELDMLRRRMESGSDNSGGQ